MIHFDAVFSPTPGNAGQIVAGVAAQRGEVRVLRGVSPYFSTTASGVKRVSSLTPLRG